MDLSTGEGGSHVAMGKARCAAVTNVKKNNVLPLADLWDFFWSVLETWIPFAAPRPEGSITEGTCAGTEKLGQLQIGSSMIDASIFSHRWDNGIRHQPSKQVITGRISKTGWIWHICQSKLTIIYCIPCWMTEESCSLSSKGNSLPVFAATCLRQSFELDNHSDVCGDLKWHVLVGSSLAFTKTYAIVCTSRESLKHFPASHPIISQPCVVV